jgi:hypothetical protein
MCLSNHAIDESDAAPFKASKPLLAAMARVSVLQAGGLLAGSAGPAAASMAMTGFIVFISNFSRN